MRYSLHRTRNLCPPIDVWAFVATGAMATSEAEKLLLHACQCSECAPLLREAIQVTQAANGEDGSQDDTSEEDQPGDVPRASRRIANANRLRAALPALAAFAALLVVGVAVVFWRTESTKPPLDQLAEAYSDSRTVDLRVPGARYAPLQATRGATGSPSRTLLEGRIRIASFLKEHPSSAPWLEAAGRADLLQWRAASAIEDFSAAAARGASSAAFWTDFATAFYERGQLTNNSGDYAQAMDYLQRALARSPHDSTVLFNAGLIHDKLGNRQQAIQDLAESIRFERDPGWEGEARERIRRLQAANK